MVEEFIKEKMNELNINYRFGNWKDDLPNIYFVGENIGIATSSEDGKREGNFLLNGFTTQSFNDLKAIDNKIYKMFRTGQRSYKNGKSVVVVYGKSQRIQLAEENVEKIEITLDYYEWEE